MNMTRHSTAGDEEGQSPSQASAKDSDGGSQSAGALKRPTLARSVGPRGVGSMERCRADQNSLLHMRANITDKAGKMHPVHWAVEHFAAETADKSECMV